MNKIWLVLCTICICTLIIIDPTLILPCMLNATEKALKLSFNLCIGYAIWLGFFEIIHHTKLPILISKLLTPLLNIIYGKDRLDKETKNFISLSMSSNILGLGGASTPMSIKAIQCMDKKSDKVNYNITMFVVISACGFQLLPTTVLSLLTRLGDTSPGKIILPSILSSLIATIIGILLVKIFVKKEES